MVKRRVYRSAVTGLYVTKEFAEENPDTTYSTVHEYERAEDAPAQAEVIEDEPNEISNESAEQPTPLPDDGINL